MATSLCMALCNGGAELNVGRLKAEIDQKWPWLQRFQLEQDDSGILSFADKLSNSSLIVAEMPKPIPAADLAGPSATSFLWPNAPTEVEKHTHHLIITATGELTVLKRANLLTALTAALANSHAAISGIYWGDATLLIPAKLFAELAEAAMPDAAPVHLWVDVRVGNNERNTTSGFTTGLQALGLMELETVNATDSPGELRERLYSIASYLLDNGLVIQNGHTVGENESERITAIHTTSAFGTTNQVIRLDYKGTTPAKPWWRIW